jgi:hypothetical protein
MVVHFFQKIEERPKMSVGRSQKKTATEKCERVIFYRELQSLVAENHRSIMKIPDFSNNFKLKKGGRSLCWRAAVDVRNGKRIEEVNIRS